MNKQQFKDNFYFYLWMIFLALIVIGIGIILFDSILVILFGIFVISFYSFKIIKLKKKNSQSNEETKK